MAGQGNECLGMRPVKHLYILKITVRDPQRLDCMARSLSIHRKHYKNSRQQLKHPRPKSPRPTNINSPHYDRLPST